MSTFLNFKTNENTHSIYEKISPNFNFINYIFIFFIGSFIGWVYETILGFLNYGLFLSKQCILIGPFIPVYGFGAILFILVFKKVKNIKIFFLISMPLGAIFEFIYSFLQELIFGTTSWDYSDYFLNIYGRTSIPHAIFWGIVGFLFIKYFLVFFFFIINKVSYKIKIILAYIIFIFMIINLLLTFLTSYRQYERYNDIKADSKLDVILDKYFPDEVLNKIYESHTRKK